jgi:hypothetical protein
MKTNLRVAVLAFTCISFGSIARAQYPTIPPALEDSANKAMSVIKKRSDEAWQKALPIIEADAKKGKPYIPWLQNQRICRRQKYWHIPVLKVVVLILLVAEGAECLL